MSNTDKERKDNFEDNAESKLQQGDKTHNPDPVDQESDHQEFYTNLEQEDDGLVTQRLNTSEVREDENASSELEQSSFSSLPAQDYQNNQAANHSHPEPEIDNQPVYSDESQEAECEQEKSAITDETEEENSNELSESNSEEEKRGHSKWAPIIYGRTYEVDFRFLVTPSNFGEEQKNLFWNYIKVTTRSAEELPNQPRWIFIRTNKRTLIGVTCMVRELLEAYSKTHSVELTKDFTRDKLGRSLYAFVGYVSETPIPDGVPEMKLELFAKDYFKYISQKWDDVYHDYGTESESGKEIKSNYIKQFTVENLVRSTTKNDTIQSQFAEQLPQQLPKSANYYIALYNQTSYAKKIWSIASEAKPEFTIFVGNLSINNLVNSEFMIGVTDKVNDSLIKALNKSFDEGNQPKVNNRDKQKRKRKQNSTQSDQVPTNKSFQLDTQDYNRLAELGDQILTNLGKLANSGQINKDEAIRRYNAITSNIESRQEDIGKIQHDLDQSKGNLTPEHKQELQSRLSKAENRKKHHENEKYELERKFPELFKGNEVNDLEFGYKEKKKNIDNNQDIKKDTNQKSSTNNLWDM